MKNLYKIKLLSILFLILFNLYNPLLAQSPVIDGTIRANEYGVHKNGSNQQTSGGVVTYMTWDANTLYIAVQGDDVNNATVVYLDKDNLVPVNGGTSTNGVSVGQLYDNTNFSNLPFKADLVLYFKNGAFEYRTNNNGGWSVSATTGMSYKDNGLATVGGVKEISIAWSAIGGMPSSFNFFSYNTSSTGTVNNAEPANNTAGTIGTNALYERYFTITSTASSTATLPFSRECYVFNNNTDEASLGSMNVYDFTMNNAARQVIRSAAGGDWNIAGTLVVNAGIVNFGGTVVNTHGASNINNVNIIAGTFSMGQTEKPMIVTGNLNMSGGSFDLSNVAGGDFYIAGNFNKTAGSLNANSRLINFFGSTQQTFISNYIETFDKLEISNPSTAGVIFNSSLSIITNFKIDANALYVQSSGTFLTTNPSFCTGTIAGTLLNNGATIHDNTKITVTGTYQHNMDGGTIPAFTWNSGSTVSVTGFVTSTSLNGLAQNFYNFTWNCPNQSVHVNFNSQLSNVLGDFSLSNSNNKYVILSTNNTPITVQGNLIVYGNGNLSMGSTATAPVINVKGSLKNNGVIYYGDATQGSIIYLSGDLGEQSNIFTRNLFSHNHNGPNGTVIFNGINQIVNVLEPTPGYSSNYQINTGSTVIVPDLWEFGKDDEVSLTVMNGGTLKIGENSQIINTNVTGNSIMNVIFKSGSTLITASNDWDQTLYDKVTFESGSNYIMNSTIPQVLGNASSSPMSLSNLIINNPHGILLTSPINVTGNMSLNGFVNSNNNNFTISNPAPDALTVGANSFINGPVSRALNNSLVGNTALGSNTTTSYLFPVASGTNYMPLQINNAVTGAVSPMVTVTAFSGDSHGTPGSGSLHSISNTEYWTATVNSGNFTDGKIQLSLPGSLSGNNVIGRSATPNGTYYSLGGTVSGNSITSTSGTGSSLGSFVLAQLSPLPVTFTSLTGIAENNKINIQWTVENEANINNYVVEHSVNGFDFKVLNSVSAQNISNNTMHYKTTDEQPTTGVNYYRIKSIDKNGNIQYSAIIKVVYGSETASIKIYPNPVSNGVINLQFTNMNKGVYELTLINDAGQTLMQKSIDHNNNLNEQLKVSSNLHGKYFLRITNPDKSVTSKQVIL